MRLKKLSSWYFALLKFILNYNPINHLITRIPALNPENCKRQSASLRNICFVIFQWAASRFNSTGRWKIDDSFQFRALSRALINHDFLVIYRNYSSFYKITYRRTMSCVFLTTKIRYFDGIENSATKAFFSYNANIVKNTH